MRKERSPYDGDAIVVLPRQLVEELLSHYTTLLGDADTFARRRSVLSQAMALVLAETPNTHRLQADEDAVSSDATPYTNAK